MRWTWWHVSHRRARVRERGRRVRWSGRERWRGALGQRCATTGRERGGGGVRVRERGRGGGKRRSRRVVCGRGLTCRHPGLSVLFCLSSECWDAVWWVMGGCTFSGCCSGRFQGWCGGEDCRSCTSIFVSTKDGTVWRWCGSWVEGRALYRQVVACERFWLDGLGGCCLLAEWWWMEWWRRRSRNVRKDYCIQDTE